MSESLLPEIWFDVVEHLELEDFIYLKLTCKKLYNLLSSRSALIPQARRIQKRRPLPISSRVPLDTLSAEELQSAITRAARLERNWQREKPRTSLLYSFSIDHHTTVYQHILLLNPADCLLLLYLDGTLACWNAQSGTRLAQLATSPDPTSFSTLILDIETTFMVITSGSRSTEVEDSPSRLHGVILKSSHPQSVTLTEVFNREITLLAYDHFLREELCGLVIYLKGKLGLQLINWTTLQGVTINCGIEIDARTTVDTTYTTDHIHLFVDIMGSPHIYTYSTSILKAACSSASTSSTLYLSPESHSAYPLLPPLTTQPSETPDGYIIISRPWITVDGVIEERIPILSHIIEEEEEANHVEISKLRHVFIDPLHPPAFYDDLNPFEWRIEGSLGMDIDGTDLLELGTAGVAALWAVESPEAYQDDAEYIPMDFWLASFSRVESVRHNVCKLEFPVDILKEGDITSMDFDDVLGVLAVAIEGGRFYLFDLAK